MPSRLPVYARTAEATKLVEVYCKGACMKIRWHEMTVPNPGPAVLKRSKVGDYRAHCLICGNMADDPYNWFAPK